MFWTIRLQHQSLETCQTRLSGQSWSAATTKGSASYVALGAAEYQSAWLTISSQFLAFPNTARISKSYAICRAKGKWSTHFSKWEPGSACPDGSYTRPARNWLLPFLDFGLS